MTDDPSAGLPLQAPLPDHVKLSRDGLNLVLDVRWFRPYHILSLLVAVAFGAFYYFMVLRSRPPLGSRLDWFTILWFGLLSSSAYSGLAGLVNHTWITVGDGAVDVKVGPLPWLSSGRFKASEISQVFRDETRTRTRSGVSITYNVNVLTPQQEKLRLVSGLDTADIALYLEQEIEKALGIPDRKVPGELQK